jgi:hypothetical protein
MAKPEINSKTVADEAKKSEQKAHKIHAIADELHKKMEKLHMETIATRERAQAALKKRDARKSQAKKAFASVKSRKAN